MNRNRLVLASSIAGELQACKLNSRVMFNKLLYLAKTELKSVEDIDLKVPFYWYYFGPMADMTEYRGVVEIGEGDDEIQTQVTLIEPVTPKNLDERRLANKGKELVREYRDKNIFETLIPEVYEHAKLPFQKDYLKFSGNFHEYQSTALKGFAQSVVEGSFRRCVRSFKPIEYKAYRTDYLFNEMLPFWSDQVKRNPVLMRETFKKFWEIYCQVLRMTPDGKEDMPRAANARWESQMEHVYLANKNTLLAYYDEWRNSTTMNDNDLLEGGGADELARAFFGQGA